MFASMKDFLYGTVLRKQMGLKMVRYQYSTVQYATIKLFFGNVVEYDSKNRTVPVFCYGKWFPTLLCPIYFYKIKIIINLYKINIKFIIIFSSFLLRYQPTFQVR